jgi:hypothetical protein
MSLQRSVQTLIVRPSKMAVRNMQNTASVPKALYIPKEINLEKPKPMISYFLAGGAFTALTGAGYVATR